MIEWTFGRVSPPQMTTQITDLKYGIKFQLLQCWINEEVTVNPLEVPPVSAISLCDDDQYNQYQFFNFFRIFSDHSDVQCPIPQLRGLMITKIAKHITNDSRLTILVEDEFLDVLQLLTIIAKLGIHRLTICLVSDKISQLCAALRVMCKAGETTITNTSVYTGCLNSTEIRQRITILSLLMSWLKSLKLTINLQLIDNYIDHKKSSDVVIAINRVNRDVLFNNIILNNWSLSKRRFIGINWITMVCQWIDTHNSLGLTISQYLPIKSNTFLNLIRTYIIAEHDHRTFNNMPMTEDGSPQARIYRTNIYTKEMVIIEVPRDYASSLDQLQKSYTDIVCWINDNGYADDKTRISTIDEC